MTQLSPNPSIDGDLPPLYEMLPHVRGLYLWDEDTLLTAV